MTNNPILLKGAISNELCKFISTELKMFKEVVLTYDPTQGIEPNYPESFSAYSPIPIETLSLHLQPVIEKEVGKQLWPSYSYVRIYKPGAKLIRHIDRRSSEYTLSCCLSRDNVDWNLVIEMPDGSTVEHTLQVGDVLLYKGRDSFHWRNGEYSGQEQIQAFIQYVSIDGNSPDLKWDSRDKLGLPFEFVKPCVKEEHQRMLKSSNNGVMTLGNILK